MVLHPPSPGIELFPMGGWVVLYPLSPGIEMFPMVLSLGYLLCPVHQTCLGCAVHMTLLGSPLTFWLKSS